MEQSVLLNFGILIFGGILIFLLGFIFYQLAFQNPVSIGKPPSALPEKINKEQTVKPQKGEKSRGTLQRAETRQTKDESSGSKRVVTANVSSRMPELSVLGIKDNKPVGSAQIIGGQPEPDYSPAKGNKTVQQDGGLSGTVSPPTPVGDIPFQQVSGSSTGQAGTITALKDGETTAAPESVAATAAIAPQVPVDVPEKNKEKKADSLMDMFADEHEESEGNKFAKKLEQVEIHDLLEESQDIINFFTRRGS